MGSPGLAELPSLPAGEPARLVSFRDNPDTSCAVTSPPTPLSKSPVCDCILRYVTQTKVSQVSIRFAIQLLQTRRVEALAEPVTDEASTAGSCTEPGTWDQRCEGREGLTQGGEDHGREASQNHSAWLFSFRGRMQRRRPFAARPAPALRRRAGSCGRPQAPHKDCGCCRPQQSRQDPLLERTALCPVKPAAPST